MSILSLAKHPPCPPLKKIWNREYGAQQLAAELQRLDRDSSYRFSIILVEVAGFSRGIASRLGYATRNEVWPKVLAFLTADIGPDGSCCRLGEDEFLLILPDTNAEKASSLAALLRRTWAAETSADTTSLAVTVAAAASIHRGETIQTLFAVIDQAMDEEKQRLREPPIGQNHPTLDVSRMSSRSRSILAGNS